MSLEEKWREKDGLTAWFGYIEERGLKSYVRFKCGQGQRRATCKKCGVILPKEVPRVRLWESWSFREGHYCLSCAMVMIQRHREIREQELLSLQQNIKDLKRIEEAIEEVLKDDRYQELMNVARLMRKIEGYR